ncbi:MAG: serine hydrolase domain-containing protein [Crocinitomicaceae bacterium]
MKGFLKVLKYFGLLIIALLIIANLIILFSGRLYIYKALSATYFRGNSGPSIYDQEVFNSRIVAKGVAHAWKTIDQDRNVTLNKTDLSFIESLNPSSFLVAWGDTIIYETYWNEHDKNSISNSFSMSKSVVALLIGIAIEEQLIQSIDEPVSNYLPEFLGEKSTITIRHILTMSSGLSWSENYAHPFCDVAELYYDTDARDLALNRRTIEEEPGLVWRYKSGDTQVLMYILEAATGKKTATYASEKIWQKIGAESDAAWSLVDQDNSEEKAYCCLYATTSDFARLGKLINQHGKWNGKSIVDSSYIAQFRTLAPLVKGNGKPNQLYGFQYWIYTGLPYEVYYFRGMLGQYIISIPSKNLVIVRTGMGTLENGANQEDWPNNISHPIEGHRLELPNYIEIGLSILEKYKKN